MSLIELNLSNDILMQISGARTVTIARNNRQRLLEIISQNKYHNRIMFALDRSALIPTWTVELHELVAKVFTCLTWEMKIYYLVLQRYRVNRLG